MLWISDCSDDGMLVKGSQAIVNAHLPEPELLKEGCCVNKAGFPQAPVHLGRDQEGCCGLSIGCQMKENTLVGVYFIIFIKNNKMRNA